MKPPAALRRFWPASLFGRLALIFLVGLVAAHALSFWLVFMERGAAARSMMAGYLARDVASSVAILERVPAAERASWLPRRSLRRPALPCRRASWPPRWRRAWGRPTAWLPASPARRA
jgi:hypothetical protein